MNGIDVGVALQALQRVYFEAGRRTGRTQAMVASLRDGDRVVFSNTREAYRVTSMCRDRGVTIQTVVCEHPRNLHEVLGRYTDARTVFDHSWVEAFFMISMTESIGWLAGAAIRYNADPPRSSAGVPPYISDILQHRTEDKS